MKFTGSTITVLIIAGIVAFGAVTPATADATLKFKKHTDAATIMGQSQPAKDEITYMKLAKDRARMDTGANQSIIIRFDQGKQYIINHTDKTYMEMPLGSVQEMMDSVMDTSEMSADEKNQMSQMMQKMMQMKATVTDTGTVEKIGNWKARKYNLVIEMAMGKTTSEIWASEEVNIDMEIYAQMHMAWLAQQQGFKDVLEEMKKIKGVHVLTKSSSEVMGAKMGSTDELLELKDDAVPASDFELPQGYTITKFKTGK